MRVLKRLRIVDLDHPNSGGPDRSVVGKLTNMLDSVRFRMGIGRFTAPEYIVFGNQKSGTSAIAQLLATGCGLTSKIDVPALWYPNICALVRKQTTLEKVIASHPRQFSFQLVKEPNFSFLCSQLKECFPDARILFVIRDPRTNIKSILDRLRIDPGQPFDIHAVNQFWQHVFDNDLWHFEHADCISMLAHRWKLVAQNARALGDLDVVRYEDFLIDKPGTFATLAGQFGLTPLDNVQLDFDRQYQPKGNHRVSVEELLGPTAITRINEICASEMEHFGYDA